MAFGFDLIPYIRIGKENILEVKTDNSWAYKEKGTPTDGEVVADGNNLPNNTLSPASSNGITRTSTPTTADCPRT